MLFNAWARQPKLAAMATTVPTVGQNRENPSVYFNPIAQQISKSPAITSNVHAIVFNSETVWRVTRRGNANMNENFSRAR